MAQLRKYAKLAGGGPADPARPARTSAGPAGADQAEAGCAGLAPFLDPRLFKALSDHTRVALLTRLASACRPLAVGEVAAGMTVDLSVVSRHLATLRDAGVVAAVRRGKAVIYSVRYPELARSLRALADAFESCCPDGPPGPCAPTGPQETYPRKKESRHVGRK